MRKIGGSRRDLKRIFRKSGSLRRLGSQEERQTIAELRKFRGSGISAREVGKATRRLMRPGDSVDTAEARLIRRQLLKQFSSDSISSDPKLPKDLARPSRPSRSLRSRRSSLPRKFDSFSSPSRRPGRPRLFSGDPRAL